jgi:4-hydroxy-tetrahydrodipicolinate synthase
MTPQTRLEGVFPVLPTPFHEDGAVDEAGLRRLVRYLLRCGVDGITYPGVASEFAELSLAERVRLTHAICWRPWAPCPVLQR